METQALVVGGATVGIWTANIGLLIHHWRRRMFNDLPEVQRPYVMVTSGGVLLTLHITFMVLLILNQVGALTPRLAAVAVDPKVLWGFLLLSLGFGIFTVIAAWHIDFAPRMQSRLRLELRDATRGAEIEALNRVELALNDPLTELLFTVRAALHENNLTPSQREKLENAYSSGRQVVAALDRVASELENGSGG